MWKLQLPSNSGTNLGQRTGNVHYAVLKVLYLINKVRTQYFFYNKFINQEDVLCIWNFIESKNKLLKIHVHVCLKSETCFVPFYSVKNGGGAL